MSESISGENSIQNPSQSENNRFLYEKINKSLDIIDKQQVDVSQSELTYQLSVQAITNILSPEVIIDGKRVKKPQIPFNVSYSKETRPFIIDFQPMGYTNRTAQVEDQITTFSSNVLTEEGQMASLKLITHKYPHETGMFRTIELKHEDSEGKKISNREYTVIDSGKAAQDFVTTYKSLNNPGK